jgi:hypothetical protein
MEVALDAIELEEEFRLETMEFRAVMSVPSVERYPARAVKSVPNVVSIELKEER